MGGDYSRTECQARAPEAGDRRRQILDAAVRVFARQGFHTCRVSDIADEAGVAYGLVYHYFHSKEQVLDTLFLERWDVLLEAIADVDHRRGAPRDKLHAVAGFIIDSYRARPRADEGDHRRGHARGELVRRDATWRRSARPSTASPTSSATRQRVGAFRDDVDADFAAMTFYGAIEQVLTGWIFGVLAAGRRRLRGGQAAASSTRSAADSTPHRRSVCLTPPDDDRATTWSSAWCGPACWPASGAVASIARDRASPRCLYRRIFDEDPPE